MSDTENGSTLANDWAGPKEELGKYIAKESKNTLDAYKHQPKLVDEHANHEEDTARGGYAHRQLVELVQNSADALAGKSDGGRIAIRLTKEYLYCGDDGEPINQDGVKALMFSHLSPKRGTDEIGRFGLGFKSVLGVTEAPEFFSRSGSFRFDRHHAQERIQQVVPHAKRYPALRLPDPINPTASRDNDHILQELMFWATNIVRLPLKPKAHDDLVQQMRNFPSKFLLFVKHVSQLTINDDLSDLDRTLELQEVDGVYLLDDGDKTSDWKLFNCMHPLSDNAKADQRSLDDGHEVPIWWAVPLDRLTDPGYFWAFFPTQTASLVAGILNAPWKTNEDRQNLLSGEYNHDLIKAAALLVADKLPELAMQSDPARHLDALPRRHEASDSKLVDLLRKQLVSHLNRRSVVPDQDGKLCSAEEVLYPPKELTPNRGMDLAPFERWAGYPSRPSNWLHHKALTRNRLAAIDRLFPPWPTGYSTFAPRATIVQWLEALVKSQESEAAVQASIAAIQTAALISSEIRRNNDLGNIVLTTSGDWRTPDPDSLFLPEEPKGGDTGNPKEYVHPELASDGDTLAALKKLGLKPPSPESRFKLIAHRVLQGKGKSKADLLEKFWMSARKLEAQTARAIMLECKDFQGQQTWPAKLRVRTLAGDWRSPHSILLPGDIVPGVGDGDGSWDDRVTVDTDFHEPDLELLENFGVADAPCNSCDLSWEPSFTSFRDSCSRQYYNRDDLPHKPQSPYLDFVSSHGAGPLEVLRVLSSNGRARYTDALLNLEATYKGWTMWHTGSNKQAYPKMPCDSLTIYMLRKHGRIRTSEGIVPFKDALGQQPKNTAALHVLLAHTKADRIKETIALAELIPEFIGEEDPLPLVDVWPGLEEYLPSHRKACQLIRCERILDGRVKQNFLFRNPDIYLVRVGDDDGRHELQLISDGLELNLDKPKLEEVLQYETRQEIEKQRAVIKECSTDAERLLSAVGKDALRRELPRSLLEILEFENEGAVLTGVQIAEAAIATYHSDALRKYRWALSHLNPPKKWAGLRPAVKFVLSLGFSAEWAGERYRKREPYLQVDGPSLLPELHDFQKAIVANVRDMLRKGRVDGDNQRGMISMPTGSGKTRVAVQAITKAMSHDGFKGGILWVADRDELCEQAVQAWRKVWSSIGEHGSQLRISRMWAGQPEPEPTSDLHVVIATIQTLNAKLSNQPDKYRFLTDFTLVVFDEAHRSIAPTFTSVMKEIGLTWRQEDDEPFLIGLTATPYRGHDEEETKWLANRYGNNRLDAGVFASDDPKEVIGELQDMDVLARADHKNIEGGTFQLSSEELKEISKFAQGTDEMKRLLGWLPRSVEDRIAGDAERTKRIIRAYEKHIDRNWQTLIFATSVEHAQTVAALLNAKGIKSRAVSGETDSVTRRRVVGEFRRGEIKVLVNYAVFREGFDAPMTQAIIVARPVYSPNLYFQMIGRGLRGVKNGGYDRCLILNVRDNIENFGEELAFSDLDWLWD